MDLNEALNQVAPAPKLDAPKDWRPAVEFDGSEGTATTSGYTVDEKPDFDKFLLEAGFDPAKYEIIGEPRTSRWQVARPFPLDPEWLTAYKFRFRTRAETIDLPLLYSQAKKNLPTPKAGQKNGKTLVILAADFQIGKTDTRGGTLELIERVRTAYRNLSTHLTKHKYEQIILVDVGDIVEGFDNAAHLQQLATNDLSIMQQVDLATTLIWDALKITCKHAPTRYISIASNHCQNRRGGQKIGRIGVDDWGIMIAKQIHRLATETQLPVTVHIPQPHDETLAIDVHGDGYHILGVAHGHQANRPEGIPDWWKKQAFGHQPIAAASILTSGHFHHTRIQELGQAHNGASRYWIQASTMDNGSNWYRTTSGEDSQPAIMCFELVTQQPFTGTTFKL